MYRIEVLVIGREMLTGRTLEADANWIAKQIASLGGRLTQFTAVDDDAEAIAAAIGNAHERGIDLLITTGGLGPTFDDVTRAGVAQALGVELAVDAEARQFIADKYFDLFEAGSIENDQLTPERERMAMLPTGAQWIENPVGTAPGLRTNLGKMVIVSLPGVPRELHAMFDLALGLELSRRFGDSGFVEVTVETDENDESTLTPIAEVLSTKHPGLHVKTNPTYLGDSDGIQVTFSAHARDPETARRIVEQATKEFAAELAKREAKPLPED